MEKKRYLDRYCDLLQEWHRKEVDPDIVTSGEYSILTELREKAVLESGLTKNELDLIYMCRKYNIFKKVNVFAHRIKHIRYP